MPSQRDIWDKEHQNPTVLPQMDSHEVSSGVAKFWQWLKSQNNRQKQKLIGLEIGCGKGRNCIWLAQQGVIMTGFDFSPYAIHEAQQRAKKSNSHSVNFFIHDASQKFPLPNAHFDFVLDCFALTDIDHSLGRINARNEFYRILKPKGFLFVYTLSTEDEFHRNMLQQHPAEEENAFFHPQTGKFEKIFTQQELLDFYHPFHVLEYQRIAKSAEFFGKSYQCQHHWLVFQKP